jgi:5-formyltetrahydrofolate cyclo-ligase
LVTKSDLRIWAKEKRKKQNIKEISTKLVEELKKTNEYRESKNIMFFYPKEFEVDLLSLLEDKSKNFFLPKINGENLLCCPYGKDDALCISCFKTKEPLSSAIDESILDMVIVPALAVDINNYRLGYGGGYYDRFLSNLNCLKVVCIPKEQILETVFAEKHDIRMDIVITA